MAMDIDGLVGLDSMTSLNQDNNLLSARSNISSSSVDDVLSSNQSRKKKSNTLSRLRKLKKHCPADLQQQVDGLSSSPVDDIKDFTGHQLEKHVNGNITELPERAHETKETVNSRIQDGREEISSLLSREREVIQKKPTPSPRIKPRRIRPLDALDGSENKAVLDGVRHNHSEFESLIGPPPLARPARITPLDGGADPMKEKPDTGVADTDFAVLKESANSNSLLRRQPQPSPRVKSRRFVNLEKDAIGDDVTTMSKEWTGKRTALSEEWSNVRDEQKQKDVEFSDHDFKPILSTLAHVSMLPPVNRTREALNDDSAVHLSEQRKTVNKKPIEDNIIAVALPTEQAVVPQTTKIVHSEPTQFENITSDEMSEEISDTILGGNADSDEDSDTDDLIIIPDNSSKKTNNETTVNISSNITEVVQRCSGDGQSDPVDEVTGSRSSLTDVSKFSSPLNSLTLTKTASNNVKAEVNQEPSLQSTDDEDLIVNTFVTKDKSVVEEVITSTQNPREESAMKHLSPEELAGELNNLSNDETLRAYPESLRDDRTLQDGGDIDKEIGEQSISQRTMTHTSVGSGGQTELVKDSRVEPPSPLILDSLPPPQASSADFSSFKPDGIDNSVATSEPILRSMNASQLSDTNRSFMSTGALSTITTRTARSKSYLSGGASTSGSLLSKEELGRFFPDRKIKIFIATWNMCEGKVLPDNLEELLLPEDCVLVQDLYVIGTQESSSDGQEWEIRLQETLGPSHVLLHSVTYGVLRLIIFIRRDLIWFCSVVEDDTVSTRAFSMIKTKGGVAAGFIFFGTSFLFINSHFTAGDEQIKERIADYEKTIKDLQLPSKVPPTRKYNNLNTDVTSRFDCIFWCGDFNFRLVENRLKIENWAGKLRDGKEKDYHILLQHDQLKKNMNKKSIFRGFHEGEIEFLPTYKYDIGGDVYDSSTKARVPSYTDRVLYKSRRSAQIHNVLYNACNSIRVSDHRPVYAMFEVKIRPGKDDSLTAGGVFSREVFNEANKRRVAKAAMSGVMMSQKTSTVCSIM